MKYAVATILGVLALVIAGFLIFRPTRGESISAATNNTPNTITAKEILRPKAVPHHKSAIGAINHSDDGDDDSEPTSLTREQVDAYLTAMHRNAGSLLAAFHETRDKALLLEAMEKYPTNAQVQFVALETSEIRTNLSAVERGMWLDRFKASCPSNTLPNYIAALDAVESGHPEIAIAEMRAAAGKTNSSAFYAQQMDDREQMFLMSGFSPAEAKQEGLFGVDRAEMKLSSVSRQMAELYKTYSAAGDQQSAEQIASAVIDMGRHLTGTNGPQFVITELVGAGMEGRMLKALDPNKVYDFLGETPAQRLQELQSEKAQLKDTMQGFSETVLALSDSDRIAYLDRVRTNGERSAMAWLHQNFAAPKAK